MSRKLVVESRLRTNATDPTSNFTMAIPNYVNINRLRLTEATIPLTYFIINSSNNSFLFTENGVGQFSATLTEGSYTNTSIETEISAQMTSIGTGVYTATIDPLTNVLTISTVGPTFSIDTTADPSNPLSIGRILGFGTSPTALALSHTLTSVINLSGPNELYITSSIIGGALEEIVVLGTPNVTNIIDRIPIFQTIGTIQTLLQPENRREIFIPDPDLLTQLDIQIRFPGGSIVDLNNSDVTLVFEFS